MSNEARIAELEAEIAKLRIPDPIPYPKTVFRRVPGEHAIERRVVAHAEEHKSIGDGWYESPADIPPVEESEAEVSD